MTKSRVFEEFTNLGVSAVSSLVEMKGKLETCANYHLAQNIPLYERPVSFGRTYANMRDLELD